MTKNDLIPHLFRTEFGRITAVLVTTFGMEHVETAEDIASETFLAAMETWPYKGIPDNPSAWLYTVAKNKARNQLRRQKTFTEKIIANVRGQDDPAPEIDLSERGISDSQLRMLFVICNPAVSSESQICLALKLLCGFGLNEIATALLSEKETVAKRIYRGKRKLQENKFTLEIPPEGEMEYRLKNVLRTLYLLFSEGYYSESEDVVVRKDLCLEAIRLTYLLIGNSSTNTHESNSLLALMCFHASRLDARTGEQGELILYRDQDRSLWNGELIEKGFHYLQKASGWDRRSKYYVEASIAYWHTVSDDLSDKWESILKLYDALLTMDPSPVIALNRMYAFAKVHGNQAAIRETEKLDMQDDHFYHVLLGELNAGLDDEKARLHFARALDLCGTDAEKQNLQQRLDTLERH